MWCTGLPSSPEKGSRKVKPTRTSTLGRETDGHQEEEHLEEGGDSPTVSTTTNMQKS